MYTHTERQTRMISLFHLYTFFKSDVPFNPLSLPLSLTSTSITFPLPLFLPTFPYFSSLTLSLLLSHSFFCLLDSASVMLQMFDSFGDGWDSAYYNVLSQDGKLLYGGNLPPQWKKESANELCLKKSQCSIIMLESLGIMGFHSFLILSNLFHLSIYFSPFFFFFSHILCHACLLILLCTYLCTYELLPHRQCYAIVIFM